jgi:hypothetical protein
MTRVLANIPILHFDEQAWSGDRMTFRVRAFLEDHNYLPTGPTEFSL